MWPRLANHEIVLTNDCLRFGRKGLCSLAIRKRSNWLKLSCVLPEGAVPRTAPRLPAPGRPVQEQSDLYLVSLTSASTRLPLLSATQIFSGFAFAEKEPK
jgi:hypothetical protein